MYISTRFATPQTNLFEAAKEHSIADLLFDNENTKSNITELKSPTPLVHYCKDSLQSKFIGQRVNGLENEFCNEFVSAPTDVGVCSTINSLHYLEDSTIVTRQNVRRKLNNSLRELEHTFFIKAATPVPEYNGQIPRTGHLEFGVQMQIHQDKDYARILHSSNLQKTLKSIPLTPGYEYTIELWPQGQLSTPGFQSLSIQQRNCRLDSEVLDGSSYKSYSRHNCIYDCHVARAAKICKCIPWDFTSMINASECDIFGRTCFFNTMESMTHDSEDFCPQCLDECDWMKYPFGSIRSSSIKLRKDKKDRFSHYNNNEYIKAAKFRAT